MPNPSPEFSFRSKKERIKLLVAKAVLAALMLSGFVILMSEPDLASDLFAISGILAATFGYINLYSVRSELIELFEPPYQYNGSEFLVAGLIFNLGGIYVQVFN